MRKAEPDPPEERGGQKYAKAAVTSSMRGASRREGGLARSGWIGRHERRSKAFWSRNQRDRAAHSSVEEKLVRGVTEAEQDPSQAQAKNDERR